MPGRKVTAMRRGLEFIEDYLPAALMGIMVVVLSAEVFARYVLSSSLIWASEIALICFIWQVYLASIGVMRRRRHVSVDVLRGMLSGRARAVLDACTGLVSTVVLALISLQGYHFVTRTNFALLPATDLSRAWLAGAILVSGIGMLLHSIVQLAVACRGIRDGIYEVMPDSIGALDEFEHGGSARP